MIPPANTITKRSRALLTTTKGTGTFVVVCWATMTEPVTFPQIKPAKINLSLFGRWEEMRMIKAVLFDMDGVLVDTEWFYNRRRVAFMEEKGFHFDEIPDLSGV